MAVRTGVGLFDVSHMGDIQFRGPGSLAAVQHISMNDASKLAVGQAHYSAMLYPEGTFVDDVLVHKLSDNDYLLVINAGTREKDVPWVRIAGRLLAGRAHQRLQRSVHAAGDPGPAGAGDAAEADQVDLTAIKNYWFTWGNGLRPPQHADRAHRLHRRGRLRDLYSLRRADQRPRLGRGAGGRAEFGILPCGLGARNTLRLESAMALYGHEISEKSTSLRPASTAYCKLDKGRLLSARRPC